MSLNKLGIDAGGTLIKVSYWEAGEIRYRKFDSSDPHNAVAWIRNHFGPAGASICITGGKASLLESLLEGYSVCTIVEFEATSRGIQYMLRRRGTQLESFLLTNVGTGTSIHHIQLNGHTRVGGTGVGGGTMVGLSLLLTGVTDYDEMIKLAEQGRRDDIDLKVKHIYEGTEPPIPGDLTASNFGNVRNRGLSNAGKTDLLAAVIGLVGETVATTSVLAAGQCGAAHIVYIGSSFIDNAPLQKAVEGYTYLRGATPVFVPQGEYSGAIGALMESERNHFP